MVLIDLNISELKILLTCLGARARCNVREMKYTTGTGRTRIPIAQLLASLRFVHEAFFTSSELVATF